MNQDSVIPTDLMVRTPGSYVPVFVDAQISNSELDFSLEELEEIKKEKYWMD